MKQFYTACLIALGFAMSLLAGHYEGKSTAYEKQMGLQIQTLDSFAGLPIIKHSSGR